MITAVLLLFVQGRTLQRPSAHWRLLMYQAGSVTAAVAAQPFLGCKHLNSHAAIQEYKEPSSPCRL